MMVLLCDRCYCCFYILYYMMSVVVVAVAFGYTKNTMAFQVLSSNKNRVSSSFSVHKKPLQLFPTLLSNTHQQRTLSSSSTITAPLIRTNRISRLLHQNRQSFLSTSSSASTSSSSSSFVLYSEKTTAGEASSSSSSSSSVSVSSSSFKEEINPGKIVGTELQIVQYPHPSLRTKNVEVTADEIKDGTIAKIAKEMFLLMYATEGVGLAAPQVGINKRLMVYNESGDKRRWLDEVVLINPKIIDTSGVDSTEIDIEGCLSFPGMNGDVERYKWIKVEAMNLRGKIFKRKYTGYEARIFQHEYDHLDGIVYIDRLIPESKVNEQIQNRLKELIEQYGEGGIL